VPLAGPAGREPGRGNLPGFAAQEALFDENGVVRGIITGDLGVDREGNPKEGLYTPGMELRGKYTLFAEGCRGHIGKQLIKRFNLDSEPTPSTTASA
jgi:electron-transferring-flavoprotein dehydrogenase